MNATTESLQFALAAANAAAYEASANPDDGGSCNMDRAVIFLDRKPHPSLGLTAVGGKYWRKGYFVPHYSAGQGFRVTRCAEAAAKSLKDAGFKATVFYHMD